MILLIDNYDSFVHNLARYFARLGQDTRVVRNDAIDVAAVRAMKPAAIILSPGPCTPREAGMCIPLVQELRGEIPILGVCLGHQCIAAALGAKIVRASSPMHGRTSQIEHDGKGLFQNISSPLTVCRYHSLVVEPSSLPGELKVTARSDDGTIMAMSHRQDSLFGVQFHPESILTENGEALLANFLRMAGVAVAIEPATLPSPIAAPEKEASHSPVTF